MTACIGCGTSGPSLCPPCLDERRQHRANKARSRSQAMRDRLNPQPKDDYMPKASSPMRHSPTCPNPVPRAERIGGWLIARCSGCRAIEVKKADP